jgi:hypothetical protein
MKYEYVMGTKPVEVKPIVEVRTTFQMLGSYHEITVSDKSPHATLRVSSFVDSKESFECRITRGSLHDLRKVIDQALEHMDKAEAERVNKLSRELEERMK